jgi:hypothetical protein
MRAGASYLGGNYDAGLLHIDFNAFFTQVVIAALLTRVFLIHTVATNETFAARVFKAYSVAARLRVVVSLCNAEIVEVS